VTPIAAYLDELALLLRRGSRRRILAEVRAHLLDAAVAGGRPGEEPEVAQSRAVARFGNPPDVARAFNAVRHRPRALVRRASAVLLATATTASLGTATVWALEPGAARHPHAAVHARHETARRTAREHRRLP
jgi:hypothetical protein